MTLCSFLSTTNNGHVFSPNTLWYVNTQICAHSSSNDQSCHANSQIMHARSPPMILCSFLPNINNGHISPPNILWHIGSQICACSSSDDHNCPTNSQIMHACSLQPSISSLFVVLHACYKQIRRPCDSCIYDTRSQTCSYSIMPSRQQHAGSQHIAPKTFVLGNEFQLIRTFSQIQRAYVT